MTTSSVIVPRQDAMRYAPVRYFIYRTTINFNLSNVRDELAAGIESLYSQDEQSLRSSQIYMEVRFDKESRMFTATFSRKHTQKSTVVNFFKRTNTLFSPEAPFVRRSRHLIQIATLCEWDRAVFEDSDGLPTTDPKFLVETEGSEVRVRATLTKMKELDFRQTYRIGSPKKQ